MNSLSLRHFLQVFLLTIIALPGSAASQQALEPEPAGGDWETWTDPPPVSGGLRVGIMTDTEDQLRDPEYVAVLLPDSQYTSLCLTVSSRDARYSASLAYDIGSAAPGHITLHIPTTMKSRLDDYRHDQLVVLAHLANRCNGSVKSFVVSEWYDPERDETLGGDVAVFVNSQLPTSIGIGDGGAIVYEADCQALSGEATAFNLRCVLPRSELKQDREAVILISEGGTRRSYPLPLGF